MEAKMKMRYDVKGLRCGAVFTTSFSFITSTSLTTVREFNFQLILSTFVNWKTIMYNYLANDHHELLLENLLSSCKVLNINTPRKRKVPKETNWKQKFQKPQNENICLTSVNTEMNGNFHFLSFCDAFINRQVGLSKGFFSTTE